MERHAGFGRYTQIVPLVVELSSIPDPARCCELLAGWPYRLLLDSAARGTRLGRYSFLMADPFAVVRSKGTRTEYLAVASETVRAVGADVLTEVRSVLAGHVADPVPGLPPFQGGAAGYLAYDWGRTLERLPECRFDDLALPDVVLGIYDWVIAWDHDESRTWLISTGLPETTADGRQRRAELRAADVQARLDANPDTPRLNALSRPVPGSDPGDGGHRGQTPTQFLPPTAPS